jgi:hypothetical protein
MGTMGAVFRSVLCAVALAMVVIGEAQAAGQPAPTPAPPPAPVDPNLECKGGTLTGSGPGFTSSRDQSEKAAREAWLVKAKEVYPDVSWETAKNAVLSCAVQGLYSKCFATGVPCHPKPK